MQNRITELAGKVAVFDLDGTLVETDAANSAAYRAALRIYGKGELADVRGRITSRVVRAALGDVSPSDMDEIARAKAVAYGRELWRTRLGPAASALRRVLRNRAAYAKIVLLTDSAERRAHETLRFHSLDTCFDEIVCNGGVGDKYANYFANFDANPAASVVWENERGMAQSAIAAGVRLENINLRKAG